MLSQATAFPLGIHDRSADCIGRGFAKYCFFPFLAQGFVGWNAGTSAESEDRLMAMRRIDRNRCFRNF